MFHGHRMHTICCIIQCVFDLLGETLSAGATNYIVYKNSKILGDCWWVKFEPSKMKTSRKKNYSTQLIVVFEIENDSISATLLWLHQKKKTSL